MTMFNFYAQINMFMFMFMCLPTDAISAGYMNLKSRGNTMARKQVQIKTCRVVTFIQRFCNQSVVCPKFV